MLEVVVFSNLYSKGLFAQQIFSTIETVPELVCKLNGNLRPLVRMLEMCHRDIHRILSSVAKLNYDINLAAAKSHSRRLAMGLCRCQRYQRAINRKRPNRAPRVLS
jgi:hypothetical protein